MNNVLIDLRRGCVDGRAAQNLHELAGTSVKGCIDGEADAKMLTAQFSVLADNCS